jgi:hypothetical protein
MHLNDCDRICISLFDCSVMVKAIIISSRAINEQLIAQYMEGSGRDLI